MPKTEAGNGNAKLKVRNERRALMTEILSKTTETAVLVDRRHWNPRRLNTNGISKV
jgi:hypothetical protein